MDFLLAQEEVECCGNRIGALAQLFRQIALADYYVPGWEPLMNIAPVGRNPVRECAKSLCCLPLRTLAPRTSSVSRHHLHVAAIPTRPATTAPLLQCRAIHEGIRVSEFIIWMIWADWGIGSCQSTLPTCATRRLQKTNTVSDGG